MWVDDVLHFWFGELKPEQWFAKDAALDARIRERFGSLHDALASGALDIPSTPRGYLAAIIVFDQFSRNLYRGSAAAFANDTHALRLAREAMERGYDRQLTRAERKFVYMPFMHSEDPEMQHRCVRLFSTLGDEESLRYAIEHRDVIDHFGRFPHRNAILQRTPTPEEAEFLKRHEGF
jgi:uncharacterized protein (DUF924 family)